jgi:hypothetical protein
MSVRVIRYQFDTEQNNYICGYEVTSANGKVKIYHNRVAISEEEELTDQDIVAIGYEGIHSQVTEWLNSVSEPSVVGLEFPVSNFD